MKPIFEMQVTADQLNTIKTALTLERERNWNQDNDTAQLLTAALEAVNATKVLK